MIADHGGARAKYFEKVVTPDKSNNPLGVVAISPDPQNTPTLADSSPTTLVISDAHSADPNCSKHYDYAS